MDVFFLFYFRTLQPENLSFSCFCFLSFPLDANGSPLKKLPTRRCGESTAAPQWGPRMNSSAQGQQFPRFTLPVSALPFCYTSPSVVFPLQFRFVPRFFCRPTVPLRVYEYLRDVQSAVDGLFLRWSLNRFSAIPPGGSCRLVLPREVPNYNLSWTNSFVNLARTRGRVPRGNSTNCSRQRRSTRPALFRAFLLRGQEETTPPLRFLPSGVAVGARRK